MNYLKRKIFNKFFKYESYIINSYDEEINDFTTRNYNLNKLNKEYERYHENVKRTIKEYDMIIGIENNKKGETFFVASNSDDSQIDIYLTSPYNISGNPFLQSILHTNCATGEKYLELTDVQPRYNSIGNGNILMKYFIKEARRVGVKYIYGILSEVDVDNFCRSIPYYEKFGFNVKLNDTKTRGKIKLLLK